MASIAPASPMAKTKDVDATTATSKKRLTFMGRKLLGRPDSTRGNEVPMTNMALSSSSSLPLDPIDINDIVLPITSSDRVARPKTGRRKPLQRYQDDDSDSDDSATIMPDTPKDGLRTEELPLATGAFWYDPDEETMVYLSTKQLTVSKATVKVEEQTVPFAQLPPHVQAKPDQAFSWTRTLDDHHACIETYLPPSCTDCRQQLQQRSQSVSMTPPTSPKPKLRRIPPTDRPIRRRGLSSPPMSTSSRASTASTASLTDGHTSDSSSSSSSAPDSPNESRRNSEIELLKALRLEDPMPTIQPVVKEPVAIVDSDDWGFAL